MRPLLLSLITFLLASLASAQTASIAIAGTGCPLDGRTPAMLAKGLPQLGQPFALGYSGPNHQMNATQSSVQPILNIGFTPLGIGIPPILPGQPVGCVMYVAPSISIPMALDPNGRTYLSSARFSVPNNAALLGAQLYAQWLAVKTQCGFAGCGLHAVAMSDFATITVGT